MILLYQVFINVIYAPINVLPQWGECGHIRAIDKKTLPMLGEIWFFLTRHPQRIGIIDHPWSRWTGPVINLSSCITNEYKRKENKNWTKDKIEPQNI